MLQATHFQKVPTLKVLGMAIVLVLAVAGGDGTAQVDGIPGDCPGVTPPETNINIAAVRLNGDGTLDPSFGENGIQELDLSTNVGNVGDAVWSIDRDALDQVLIFGATKGADPRVDGDRLVVRLSADGVLDPTFATAGLHTLNIANLNDNARNGQVLPDGKILTAGYTGQPTGVGTQSANRPVLLRLNSDGTPDITFGVEGVVNAAPFIPEAPQTTPWGFAEAYAARPQSFGSYVTAGYGRQGDEGPVDIVSLRFTPDGVLDPTWGLNGIFQVDIAGDNDRARNLVVLPDDRVLIVGLTTPLTPSTDALVVMLTANGALDPSFNGTGWRAYDFGGTDEQFYGAALSPSGSWVAAVGYTSNGVDGDENATLLILSLVDGTEVAQVVPLSGVEDDRFWSVAFDAQERIYAAGFATVNGDSFMVVARYTTAGALDPSFGTGGIVTVNILAAGTAETARGIVVQSTGKIVIAGTVEAP
jgi:uncharacterized delta-60 repeat protein